MLLLSAHVIVYSIICNDDWAVLGDDRADKEQVKRQKEKRRIQHLDRLGTRSQKSGVRTSCLVL